MITSVDTSVLLDVFLSDAQHYSQSRERLSAAYNAGDIIVCGLVYAELVPAFGDRAALGKALQAVNATTSPIDTSISYEAGLRWMRYRRAGGPRKRIIADFLIGAHANAKADVFLTRDYGLYATYFPELKKPGSP